MKTAQSNVGGLVANLATELGLWQPPKMTGGAAILGNTFSPIASNKHKAPAKHPSDTRSR